MTLTRTRECSSFSNGMVEAFINYAINVYPKGVEICRSLHSLSVCNIQGVEKEENELKDEWQFLEILITAPSYYRIYNG
jgi:hypothetical protein